MDAIKYDRQIRLFGKEVQEKLCQMTVQVYGTSNAITMEVIKNLVLLGIGTLVIEEKMIAEVEKYIPNKLNEINENLIIRYSNDIVEADFHFFIDVSKDKMEHATLKNCYYICSTCISIHFNYHEHDCEQSSCELLLPRYCLIGAYAVQEFIKFIQGKRNSEEYKFEF